jgi:hypothetical protein
MWPVGSTSRARVLAGAAALLVLVVLTVLTILSVLPPAPRDADVPAGEFSAARAFAHVERVGTQVHVAGSPAAANVRTYLETTLRDLGLQTNVQEAVGAESALRGSLTMAQVRNVVAVLPGTASTGRVIMVAHYDSVQISYGGSDDGAGVATLLETARALTQGDRPRNDVVFLFTDAEEACLCGAEAFVSQHDLAADGGVVLNFEARGSSGPVIMFETTEGNTDLVDVFGTAAPTPVGTSFAVEVYRILPNDTDFTPFLEAGRFTGLNSAYIDGSAAYHTPQDKPSYMDRSSLQHHGDNALGLARALAGADLTTLAQPSAYDATYFPALTLLVRYPGWLVWPFAVLALVAVAGLAGLVRRRGLITGRRLAAGFGLALVPLLGAPVSATLMWLGLVAVRPAYGVMLDPWRPGWFRLAVVALVATVLLTWYGLLRRRMGSWPLILGGLGWLAVLGLVLAAATPGGSYLAALPALAAAAAGLISLALGPPLGRLAVAVAGAVVAVIILAPTVLLFFPALGLATGGAAAFFAVMLGLALLPVIDWIFPPAEPEASPPPDAPGSRRRLWSALPAATAGLLALAGTGVGLAVDRFDAAHPAPTHLMYALDADTGQARWASLETDPTDWTGQYVSGREDLSVSFPILTEELSTGPAQAASLPAPTLRVVSDVVTGGQRTLTVNLIPQRPVRLAYLGVEGDATVLRAVVAGREIPGDQLSNPFGVAFHAPPPVGVSVTLVLSQPGPVSIRVLDGSDGLDGLPGFEPRPADVGSLGSHSSDLVLVAKTYPV